MAYKVLVVDDSSFFRRRVTDILNKDPELDVVDLAINGQEAVEKAILLKPDVITMDIEMPVLNGIEAVKQIMARSPTAILMFSSLTHKGAKLTIEALEAGALDFLPKKFSDIAQNTDEAGSVLRQRVAQLAKKSALTKRNVSSNILSNANSTLTQSTSVNTRKSSSVTNQKVVESKDAPVASVLINTSANTSGKNYKLLAIGTSTGGPVALQRILTQLPKDFPLPIIIVQHMPATFTPAFANRLDTLCQINVKEASDGDILKAGCAYLAPGGHQMVIIGTKNAAKIKIIDDASEKIMFKPCVDISFGSAAKVFSGDVLGLILTGMGADGREGSRMLKTRGATIWAQDEQSSVVYGMPQAVTIAGISQLSLPLEAIPRAILKEIKHG